MLVTIFIDTDNQIPRKQLHRYGYVIEAKGHTVEGFGEAEETFSGTILTALLTALGRIRATCELKICLRKCRIGMDLAENLLKWQTNGWKRGSGQPVMNADLWKQVAECLENLQITDVKYENLPRHEYSSWIQAEIKRKIMT